MHFEPVILQDGREPSPDGYLRMPSPQPHPRYPTLLYRTATRVLGRLNSFVVKQTTPDGNIWAKIKYGSGTSFTTVKPMTEAVPEKYRRMFLSQPPIRKVAYVLQVIPPRNISYKFKIRPNDQYSNLGEQKGTLTRDAGITVRDLVDKVTQVEKESGAMVNWHGSYFHGTHRLCPSTFQEEHMSRGPVFYRADFDLEYMKRKAAGEV